jgi:hypothetical protein
MPVQGWLPPADDDTLPIIPASKWLSVLGRMMRLVAHAATDAGLAD